MLQISVLYLASMPMNLGIVHLLLFPLPSTYYFRNGLTRAMLDGWSGSSFFARVFCFPAILTKAELLMEGREGGRLMWRARNTFCMKKHFLFFLCVHFNRAGNDSKVDGLVNFEKLRMIAKEIRQVVRMTSANMDPAVMFRQRCAN